MENYNELLPVQGGDWIDAYTGILGMRAMARAAVLVHDDKLYHELTMMAERLNDILTKEVISII